MKRNDVKKIVVDGQTIVAQYLGKGCFTTAYRYGSIVYLFTPNDNMKEMLSNITPIPHLPKTKLVERTDNYNLYSMPYYEPVRPNFERAWKDYTILHACWRKSYDEVRELPRVVVKRFDLRDWGYLIAETITEKADVSIELKKALQVLTQNMSDYGASCTFEFNRSNLSVDENGDLILRDICFDSELTYQKFHKNAIYRA